LTRAVSRLGSAATALSTTLPSISTVGVPLTPLFDAASVFLRTQPS